MKGGSVPEGSVEPFEFRAWQVDSHHRHDHRQKYPQKHRSSQIQPGILTGGTIVQSNPLLDESLSIE